MSDSSSITGANNPAGLPEKFSFTLSYDEAQRTCQMAQRYAPEMPMGFRFQVQFGDTKRRWVMREQNITGFIEVRDASGPDSGHLTLTVNVLEYITEMFESIADTTITVDFSTNSLSIAHDDMLITLDLPWQDKKALDVSFAANSYINVDAGEIAHLGRGIGIFPVAIDVDELTRPLPFIDFHYSKDQLTARRDWSHFGGPTVAITIPAHGAADRHFSSFANALPRELYFADVYDIPLVGFQFSDETPNVAFLNGLSWGIRIELGNETVYQYRSSLVDTLSENEIDVDADERIGWSPIVNCHFDGSDISVEIVKGLAGQPDYFRLSTVVLPDSPWNLEIASEINAWNNQWTNVKLVRHETNLVALRDVVAEELDLTPEAVVDLVKKSKVVAEVVSVFL
jgi:hypothetical protein